jgi:hypothetical protein
MKKKTFLLVVLLMAIGGFIFYITCPKYDYIDDQTPDLLRFNKITGSLEVCKDGTHWYRVVSKSVAKVERLTISYDEFMGGRENFQKAIEQIKKIREEGTKSNIAGSAFFVLLAMLIIIFVRRGIKFIKQKKSEIRRNE